MSGTGRKISSSEQIFRRAGIISESDIVKFDLYNLFCTEFNPVSNLKRTRKQAEMPQSLGKGSMGVWGKGAGAACRVGFQVLGMWRRPADMGGEIGQRSPARHLLRDP